MTECRNSAEAGFTLIELLVAMTLLGFLSIALFGSLSQGVRIWKRTEAATQSLNRLQLFATTLEGRLSHAVPRSLISTQSRPRLDFWGTEDRVEFLAEDPIGSGKISRITYSRNTDSNLGGMKVSAEHELESYGRTAGAAIIKDIRSVDFGYFGSPSTSAPARWYTSWTDATELPTLIRARITPDEDKRHSIEIVISPKLSADTSCVYDLITRRCEPRS